MRTCGALVFCESPVHTDSFFAGKAKELVRRAGVDWIMIKDSGGLLGIDRVRTLVPAIRRAVGDVPIELHSHCLTGLAPLVYLEGARLGADMLDTSIAPLANGPAQPATQTILSNLRMLGFDAELDVAAIEEVGDHFRRVAEQEGLPLGVPMAYDAFHYEHQLPGGMLTNLKYQLSTVSMADRFDAVLEECARIRQELAWPIMVTPFAQLVGTQAVLNVLHGERYKIVPDEVKKYVLGYYGKLLAAVDPEALDRIMAHGSPRIAASPEPPPPAVEALRKKYPGMSDEERLMRFCLAGSQVDEMRASGPMRTDYSFARPIDRLVKELAARRSWHFVRLEGEGVCLTLRASGEARDDRRVAQPTGGAE
jgi:oxaloacetate decarboxylase (Na+ extruding) subunit alpha